MSGNSGGGSSQSGSVVNTSQPWSGQVPYLEDIYKQAQGAQDKVKNLPSYTGNFIAGPNQSQKDTNTLAFNTGQNAYNVGGQLAQQGSQTLNNTLNTQVAGQVGGAGTPLKGMDLTYLNPNANPNLMPALQQGITQNAKLARDTLFPQIGKSAWNDGAYGGTAHGTALARTANQIIDSSAAQTANALSNVWNQAYTTERGIQAGQEGQLANQQQQWNALLAQLGPQLLQSGLSTQGGGLQTMQGAGAVEQGWGQDQIANALSQENYNLQRPFQNLNTYAGLIGGAIPGGGTQTQYAPSSSMFGNFLGGALGGGAIGAGVGSLIPGIGPLWGLAGGAGLGSLAGIFG